MLHITRSKLVKLWKPGRRKVRQYGGVNSPPTSWILPQELVDHTVDFLHDDKEALVSCSLVSRQWNGSAKPHLFASIHISGSPKLLTFLGFIQSPNSVCVHIRSLRLNGQYPNLRPVVTVDILSIIFNSLPLLAHLSLYHVHLVNIKHPHDRTTLSDARPQLKLRQLTFAYAGGAPHHIPEHFLDIIGMFSNIDELSMIYPRFEHTTLVASDIAGQLEMSLANAIPKELRVKKIVIEDTTFGTQFWLETLRRTASVQTLFSVTVLTSFSWDLGPVGFLLAAVGSNLRSLKLDVTGILSLSDAPSARICGLLCLSSCTGLKHFSLRTKSPTDAPTAESWERICNMVAAVAAHGTLETFTLSGYFGPLLTEFHNFREWAPLHEALSASSALRKVAFVDEAWRTISPRVVALVAPRLRDYHLALPEDVEVRVQADEPQGE